MVTFTVFYGIAISGGKVQLLFFCSYGLLWQFNPMHSKRPKLYMILAFLSAIRLMIDFHPSDPLLKSCLTGFIRQ